MDILEEFGKRKYNLDPKEVSYIYIYKLAISTNLRISSID
jgi:hypothetical protein